MERHNIEFHSPIEIKFKQGQKSSLIRKKRPADKDLEEQEKRALLLEKQSEEDEFYRKLIGANFFTKL